jgi:hypothetical protein
MAPDLPHPAALGSGFGLGSKLDLLSTPVNSLDFLHLAVSCLTSLIVGEPLPGLGFPPLWEFELKLELKK